MEHISLFQNFTLTIAAQKIVKIYRVDFVARLTLILGLLCLIANVQLLLAQSWSNSSLMQENWGLTNPAFFNQDIGSSASNKSFISAYYQQQKLNNSSGDIARKNIRFEQILSNNPQHPKVKFGLGLDNISYLSTVDVGGTANFAWFSKIGASQRAGTLGIGFNVKAQSIQIRLQESWFQNWSADLYAQSLNNQKVPYMTLNYGFFYRKESTNQKGTIFNYYGGVAVEQFRAMQSKTKSLGQQQNFFPANLNIMLGCQFRQLNPAKSNELKYWEPYLWIRHSFEIESNNTPEFLIKQPLSIDLAIRGKIFPTFWVSTGYNTFGNLNFGFGYEGWIDKCQFHLGFVANVPMQTRLRGWQQIDLFSGLTHENKVR